MTVQTAKPSAAVIVIDLQTAMFSGASVTPIHGADRLVQNVQAVMQWARETDRKVAFIRHDGGVGELFAPGAPGWPVWPALGQAEDEPTFSKTVGDAFSQPALVDWVERTAAEEVIVLGAQTDHCVAATVRGALGRGLKVTVVGDAHSTWDNQGDSAEQIVIRHNALFSAAGAEVLTAKALMARSLGLR